jgi:NhaP-type Na+/H+ or K+/H+ antiporter
MSFDEWVLALGVLLLAMVFAGTLLSRLPLTGAMVYLLLGWLLGPDALGVMRPDPLRYAATLERLAEVGLLVSLFAVGLRLEVPLRDRRWRLPLRLAFLSLAAMVILIAGLGMLVLDLSPGAAVLLGAILAPTDPVLAAGVQSQPGADPDRLGFSLAGEGGLNDGAAFPFAVLGMGLLAHAEHRVEVLHWIMVEFAWATIGGLAIGATWGAAVGHLVVFLRSRHGQAVGLDVFLGLGLIGLAYGVAQLCHASGFLAVFAAGLALRRVGERPRSDTHALGPSGDAAGHGYSTLATHSHHASATMRRAVETFNEQVERIAEMALVLLVGAMLPYAVPLPAVWWFVPLLLLVLRPLSVLVATVGEGVSARQRAMMGWFGIRGIGSVFYLLWALRQGLEPATAQMLVSLTLWTVAASIVAHGLTAQPLMKRYGAR